MRNWRAPKFEVHNRVEHTLWTTFVLDYFVAGQWRYIAFRMWAEKYEKNKEYWKRMMYLRVWQKMKQDWKAYRKKIS